MLILLKSQNLHTAECKSTREALRIIIATLHSEVYNQSFTHEKFNSSGQTLNSISNQKKCILMIVCPKWTVQLYLATYQCPSRDQNQLTRFLWHLYFYSRPPCFSACAFKMKPWHSVSEIPARQLAGVPHPPVTGTHWSPGGVLVEWVEVCWTAHC